MDLVSSSVLHCLQFSMKVVQCTLLSWSVFCNEDMAVKEMAKRRWRLGYLLQYLLKAKDLEVCPIGHRWHYIHLEKFITGRSIKCPSSLSIVLIAAYVAVLGAITECCILTTPSSHPSYHGTSHIGHVCESPKLKSLIPYNQYLLYHTCSHSIGEHA